MNELTTTERPTSLAPKTLDEALRFAEMLSKSELVPKDYQGKPANAFVAIQWGMELGLAPLQAMQNIAVINGRPSLWGDAQLALVMSHPSYEWHSEVETDEAATVTVKRKNLPECVRTFTLKDAAAAGLSGKQGPWQTARKRMMKLRARAFALRDTFPDVLRGLANAEEAGDTPPEVDLGRHDHTPPPAPSGPRRRSETQPDAAAPAKAETVDAETGEVVQERAEDPPVENARTDQPAPMRAAAGTLTTGQVAYLRNKLRAAGIGEPAICSRFQVESLDQLSAEAFATVKAELLELA